MRFLSLLRIESTSRGLYDLSLTKGMLEVKFFVFSDVHSHLEPLQKALKAAGFDPNNEGHYLISCGDAFDRGPDSVELFHYLMSIERKILVKGNHDILLDDCCKRGFPYSHDKSNGTIRTIQSISGKQSAYDFGQACEITYNKLTRYRELLVNYFETKNYIFVHSWIPTRKVELENAVVRYTPILKDEWMEDWRSANDVEWEEAMWGNPFMLAEQDLNKTDKTIVFGHFHTSYQWSKNEKCSEFGEDAIFEPYYGKNSIGIDACTAYTNRVNVIVIEDEFINGNK